MSADRPLTTHDSRLTTIKICGITDLRNALVAIDAGADYLGFVFYPPSIRALDVDAAARLIATLRTARPEGWLAVGVFVNEPLGVIEHTLRSAALDVVQLNGEETPDYVRQVPAPVFKAVRVSKHSADSSPQSALPTASAFGAERILVDANVPGRYGGTGVTYDWAGVRLAVRDGFLAGGLTPNNVGEAMATAQPWGLDVSSGVERDGVKQPKLIERFILAVRDADRRNAGVSPARPASAQTGAGETPALPDAGRPTP